MTAAHHAAEASCVDAARALLLLLLAWLRPQVLKLQKAKEKGGK